MGCDVVLPTVLANDPDAAARQYIQWLAYGLPLKPAQNAPAALRASDPAIRETRN
jgi:hypothetical protein